MIQSKPLMWRKLGGGSMRLGNRIIKPNERFSATVEEIPESFRDLVHCLDAEALKEAEKTTSNLLQGTEKLYKMKKIQGTKTYNVLGPEKKKINQEPLSRKDAMELRDSLNG